MLAAYRPRLHAHLPSRAFKFTNVDYRPIRSTMSSSCHKHVFGAVRVEQLYSAASRSDQRAAGAFASVTKFSALTRPCLQVLGSGVDGAPASSTSSG